MSDLDSLAVPLALAERVRRLRLMADGWDRCAAQPTGDRSRGRPETYERWAAACRAKADALAAGLVMP